LSVPALTSQCLSFSEEVRMAGKSRADGKEAGIADLTRRVKLMIEQVAQFTRDMDRQMTELERDLRALEQRPKS
jgi:molybdenum-dependent DNA-binding transcriptional regulator ModE